MRLQYELKKPELRKYGCYFLCLLKIVEDVTRLDLDERFINYYYDYCVYKGWLEKDCTVINPCAILEHMTKRSFMGPLLEGVFDYSITEYTAKRNESLSHFVLTMPKFYDPMNYGAELCRLYDYKGERRFI